jgi:hypothetical protein
MSKHIVKIQLPLETNADVPHMLIYTKDRSTIYELTPVDERFAKELSKFPHKGFYEASLTPGGFKIGQRVGWQSW